MAISLDLLYRVNGADEPTERAHTLNKDDFDKLIAAGLVEPCNYCYPAGHWAHYKRGGKTHAEFWRECEARLAIEHSLAGDSVP